MVHPLLPVVMAATYATLSHVNLHAQSKDPLSCLKFDKSVIIIADDHAGEDPHGDDPHGHDPHDRGWLDPHDQRHNDGPANDNREKYPGTDDPYSGFEYKVPQPNP